MTDGPEKKVGPYTTFYLIFSICFSLGIILIALLYATDAVTGSQVLPIASIVFALYVIVAVFLQYLGIKRFVEFQHILEESEDKFSKAFISNPTLYSLNDYETAEYVEVNDSFCSVLGYSRAEVIGKRPIDLGVFARADLMGLMDKMTREGRVRNLEVRFHTKSGKRGIGLISSEFMESGGRKYLVSSASDITEHKEAEERHKTLIENLTDLIIIVDENRKIKWISPSTKHYGFQPHDLVGLNIFDFTYPEEEEKNEEAWDWVLKHPHQSYHEKNIRNVAAEGRVIHTDNTYVYLPDFPGIEGILIVAHDITEKVIAESFLKESEERFRIASQIRNDVIYEWYPFQKDLNKSLLFYGIENVVEQFGLSSENIPAKIEDWGKYVHREDMPKLMNSVKLHETLKTPIEEEYRFVLEDGTTKFWKLKSIPCLDKAGNLIKWIGGGSETTEEKRTQELMIQTEKMMSVGGLAAGMAHEINNPLGAIMQGAQNLERRLSPDLAVNIQIADKHNLSLKSLQAYLEERKILLFLDSMKESGQRAATIVKDMLRFSRKSESKMAPTDLAELIENVLELAGKDYDLKKKYDFRKVRIIKEFDSNLPLVPCTQTEIEQVVLNLLKNASQAMAQDHGNEPHRIVIRLSNDEHLARIEVEDNGPGIDEKIRKRIFEPFFTTKPVGEGTGLGLSVSYMIISHNHKGTLEVESELGNGTKFLIGLPLE